MLNERGTSMKRALCLVLILCLLPACGFADGLAELLDRFAVASGVCGAPELPDESNRIDNGSYCMIEYRISDKLISGFMEKDGEISGGYAVCLDPSLQGDFLALCASHALTVCGVSEGLDAYTFILDNFLDARQGKETEETITGNMIFSIFAMKTGLAFNYSIIGN